MVFDQFWVKIFILKNLLYHHGRFDVLSYVRHQPHDRAEDQLDHRSAASSPGDCPGSDIHRLLCCGEAAVSCLRYEQEAHGAAETREDVGLMSRYRQKRFRNFLQVLI